MSGPPTPLQNIYYERKTATAKPCYICHRPTQTVLATLKTDDFLYTCDGHLTDPYAPLPHPPAVTAEPVQRVVSHLSRGIKLNLNVCISASPIIIPPPPPPTPTAEDVKRVVSEHQAREAKKLSKPDEKGAKPGTPPPPPPPPLPVPVPLPVSTPPPPTDPSHRKFALHRSIFEMRKGELRRKEQAGKAKEVSKGMPQVPRGAF